MNKKAHIYKTKIDMTRDKKYFHRQIDKLIKEKMDFDDGSGFNPKCKCKKCLKRKLKRTNNYNN